MKKKKLVEVEMKKDTIFYKLILFEVVIFLELLGKYLKMSVLICII